MRKLLTTALAALFFFSQFANADSRQLQRLGEHLILAGELSNSAVTSTADIPEALDGLREMGLNTVLVPVYWEFCEPEEGKFDWTLADAVMDAARERELQVIPLWFGAWKNSMSCYAPLWFKEDTKRFPRAVTASGEPLEIASAFSDNVLQADKKAFLEFIRHINATAADVVPMVQVENEIGMIAAGREFTEEANRLWESPVPSGLTSYLKSHKKTLHPVLASRYNSGGKTWAAMFGDDVYGEEIFMAWYYATYVEQLAKEAKGIMDIPLYVNAALNSRGRKPGEYPSAGPLAHLIDIWHAAAPHIDLLAPDIYDTGFKDWVSQYNLENNRLFIPEIRRNINCGARAIYVFGEHNALGFSPFAIDQYEPTDSVSISRGYALLSELEPLLLKYRGTSDCRAVLCGKEDKETILVFDDIRFTMRHDFTLPWDPRSQMEGEWPEGAAIVIRLAPMEYIIAGTGIVTTFSYASSDAGEDYVPTEEQDFSAASSVNGMQRVGIGYVDEVRVSPDGSLNYVRRDNGDQDHQGRHARITLDSYRILHVKLYPY